jgi:hypothetical protein
VYVSTQEKINGKSILDWKRVYATPFKTLACIRGRFRHRLMEEIAGISPALSHKRFCVCQISVTAEYISVVEMLDKDAAVRSW